MNTTGSTAVQARPQDVVRKGPERRPRSLTEADIERAVAEAFAAVFRRGVFGGVQKDG